MSIKKHLGVTTYKSLKQAFADIAQTLKRNHAEVFQRMPQKENDSDKRNKRPRA